jgi:hypothetical protein
MVTELFHVTRELFPSELMCEGNSCSSCRAPPPFADSPPSTAFSFPSHFPSLDSVAGRPLSSPPFGSAIFDYSTPDQSLQFGLFPDFAISWRTRCPFGLVSGRLDATSSSIEFESPPGVRFCLRSPDVTSLLVQFRHPFDVGRLRLFVEAQKLPRGKTEIGFTTAVIHKKFPFGSIRGRFAYGRNLTAAVALRLGSDYQCRITFDGTTVESLHWFGRPDSFLVSDLRSIGFCHFFSKSGISGRCTFESKAIELRGATAVKGCEFGAVVTCTTEPLKIVKWEVGAWTQLPKIPLTADPQLFVKVGTALTVMGKFRVGDVGVEAAVRLPKAEFSSKLTIHQ